MNTATIAKNILLDHTCENCKFVYGSELQYQCKKVVYNTIEGPNEEGYITVEQLYPEENTCGDWEDWEEISSINIKNIKINSIYNIAGWTGVGPSPGP